MLSVDDVNLVKTRMDIVTVISNFITLKKKGAQLEGVCPFHSEKTGSLMVSPSKNIYKCFGCGKSGSAITFVMEHESIPYPEAIKWIGNSLGIEVREVFNSPEEQQKATDSESIKIINRFAVSYFQSRLSDDRAIAFIKERGISEAAIKHFSIGYTGEDSTGFHKALISGQYGAESARNAGLLRQYNGGYIDVFRERLMFPFFSISGNVVGFSGRIVDNTIGVAKYTNTAENTVFHKGSVLYGIFQAKGAMSKKKEAFLVEGQVDVVSMWESAVENVVAPGGTAFTKEHALIIKRLCPTLVFVLDGDSAGYTAAVRGVRTAMESGLSVRIVSMPAGEDPDSLARKAGKEFLNTYVHTERMDIVEFYKKRFDSAGPDEKDLIFKELVGLLSIFPSDAIWKRQHYSKKICSIFDTSMTVLNEYSSGSVQETPVSAQPVTTKEPNLYKAERELTKMLLKYGNLRFHGPLVAEVILGKVEYEPTDVYTPNKITNIVHTAFVASFADGELMDVQDFVSHEDKDVSAFASAIIFDESDMSEWAECVKEDYIASVSRALAMYTVFHCKMNLHMLETVYSKGENAWEPELIKKVSDDLKSQIRAMAKTLGLIFKI